MTNIILDALPTKAHTESGNFELVTDFRASVKFEIMVEKGELNIFKLLSCYFPGGLPKDITGATDAVIWFYQCGNEENKEELKPIKSGKKSYSFEVDAAAIYADFLRYYDIDLTSAKLHWWKFRELLAGLPSESAFKERIYYRICDLKGLPKKEQQRIKAIRREIEIKTAEKEIKLTLEERNKQMLDYVKKRSEKMRG